MKRLIIVCEGPTENEFCLEMLAPILLKSDIYVEAPLIKNPMEELCHGKP